MKVEHDEIVRAFTEWYRRFRNEPEHYEYFVSKVEPLLRITPETYGAQAAICFEKILEDVRRK